MGTSRQIHAQFWKNAQLGSGRAFLIFREHKNIDFTRGIILLCLKNYGYDPQCEGDRSEYAMQFVRELSEEQRALVFETLKQHLEKDEITDDWDFIHFCHTAVKIAHEFEPMFGEILRKRFDECDEQTLYDAFPSSAIIKLDGFDGMVRVARKFGRSFKSHDDWYEDDYYMLCVPKMKSEDVQSKLVEFSKSDDDIRTYLDRIEECKKESEERKAEQKKNEPENNFECVKKYFYSERGIVPRRYAKNLTIDEAKYFADEMTKVKTQKELTKYLRLFSSVPYPYNADDLISLFSKNKNSYFNNYLVDVLSYFASPEIRRLAERALISDEYSPFYLALLKKNYREGDGAKIARKLKSIKNFEDAHYDVIDVTKIYEENVTPDCIEPLTVFYERTKCGLCRTWAAELMEKAGVLPQNIREELPFDSATLNYDNEQQE